MAVAGANSPSYSRAIYDNDTVYCVITSNINCATATTVTSNAVVVYEDYLHLGIGSYNTPSLALFPNPNSGSFTLSGAASNSLPVQLEVRDVLGRVVYTGAAENINGNINTSIRLSDGIPAGSYMLRVINGATEQNIHFVVNK
jgi:hypothetical protein